MHIFSDESILLIWVKLGSTATPGTGLPGRFGVDYAFINKSAIDIYVDKNKASGRAGKNQLKLWLTVRNRSTYSELRFFLNGCAHSRMG